MKSNNNVLIITLILTGLSIFSKNAVGQLNYSTFNLPNSEEFHRSQRFLLLNNDIKYFENSIMKNSELKYTYKPPLHADKIANQLIWSTIGGWFTGGIIFVYVYYNYPSSNASQENTEKLDFNREILPFCIGTTIGSSAMVRWIGNLGEETGSFYWTIAGSMIGSLIGVAVNLEVLPFFLPQLGATIAFNSTRRYKYSNESQKAKLLLTEKGILFQKSFSF